MKLSRRSFFGSLLGGAVAAIGFVHAKPQQLVITPRWSQNYEMSDDAKKEWLRGMIDNALTAHDAAIEQAILGNMR